MSPWMFVFPQPQYVACPDCGACVPRAQSEEHVCDAERRLEYQLVRLRPEIARFEDDLAEWLASSEGRFERFYAERSRAAASVTGARQANRSHV